MPFEKRYAGCEEREKINRRRIYDTLRINFFEATKQTACIFSKGEETGVNYYGARYLDPKYSRWLSGDPALSDYIPKAPIDDEAKKHNENLPGMGGVFNVVNLHLYHYAGNNPVKYTDPDGRVPLVAILIVIGFAFALQSDVQPVTHIDAAVTNNKLSSIYYDDLAKRTGSEIKSPYTRETSRAIKLEQHPVLALGAALPRGNGKEFV